MLKFIIKLHSGQSSFGILAISLTEIISTDSAKSTEITAGLGELLLKSKNLYFNFRDYCLQLKRHQIRTLIVLVDK
jgi:hypothetical protein